MRHVAGGDTGVVAGGSSAGGSEHEAFRIEGLDGLRALAILGVLAIHLGIAPGGFLGVQVFFVTSGFLITTLLVGERRHAGRVDLRAFYVRRFARLTPGLV